MNILDLPDDCIIEILNCMTQKQLYKMSHICRFFRHLIDDMRFHRYPFLSFPSVIYRPRKLFKQSCINGDYIGLARNSSLWDYKRGMKYAYTAGDMDIANLMIKKEPCIPGLEIYIDAFYGACKNGRIDLIKKTHLSMCDIDWSAAMYNACKSGSIGCIEYIGKYIKYDLVGSRHLLGSCLSGNLECFNYIIPRDHIGYATDGLLPYACRGGNIDIINMILDNSKIDIKDIAESISIVFGNIEKFSSVINRILPIYRAQKTPFIHRRVFRRICKRCSIDIIKIFISYFPDEQPLWYDGLVGACRGGYQSMSTIEFLLNKNTNHVRILLHACHSGDSRVVKHLLSKKYTYKNRHIHKAFIKVCSTNNTEILQIFNKAGYTLNNMDYKYIKGGLYNAIKYDCYKMVKFILNNYKDRIMHTIEDHIHKLIYSFSINSLRVLLNYMTPERRETIISRYSRLFGNEFIHIRYLLRSYS